eukprot:m.249660 g.249660  ORF g.249660 m.249660 type:complete len:739 (+) comp17513_c1_seq30:1520-3736(+)
MTAVQTTISSDAFQAAVRQAKEDVNTTMTQLQRLKRDQDKADFQDQKLNSNLTETQSVSQACLSELARNDQRFAWWLGQRGSIIQRLTLFLEFRQGEIKAAVRNEALKSAKALKHLQETCSSKKIVLGRATMRADVAESSMRAEEAQKSRGQALMNMTQDRLGEELQEGNKVASQLKQTQLDHREATALHRAAVLRWEEACKHADLEQQRAATAYHSAVAMVEQATAILAEERAVDAPPDYSDTLMEQIQAAMERRKELQEKVDRSRGLKEKASHHVKQLQHTVSKLENEHSNLAGRYQRELQDLIALKQELQDEDAAQEAEREKAYQAMVAANNSLSQAQEQHHRLTARLAKAQEDVHSCDREKQARQAQMERIAGQSKAAVISHTESERRVGRLQAALDERVKEQRSTEKAVKQCVEELRSNVATEQEHVKVVTEALGEAKTIRARLAVEKEEKLGDLTRTVRELSLQLDGLQASEAEMQEKERVAVAEQALWQSKLDAVQLEDEQARGRESVVETQADEARAEVLSELKSWTSKVKSAPSRRQAMSKQIIDCSLLSERLKEHCQAARAELDTAGTRADKAHEEVERLLASTRQLTMQSDELDEAMAQLKNKRNQDVKTAQEAIALDKEIIRNIYLTNPNKIKEYEEVQAERLQVRHALQTKLASQVNAEVLLSSAGERQAAEARYAYSVEVFSTAQKLKQQHLESTSKLTAVANALDPGLVVCSKQLHYAGQALD